MGLRHNYCLACLKDLTGNHLTLDNIAIFAIPTQAIVHNDAALMQMQRCCIIATGFFLNENFENFEKVEKVNFGAGGSGHFFFHAKKTPA